MKIINIPRGKGKPTRLLYISEYTKYSINDYEQINALISTEDGPLNADYVIYWAPLPNYPKFTCVNKR